MSRETDSPSPGPRDRGGAPYPTGTDPYGSAGAGGTPSADAGSPEERKTETTLTTRIRINIPGSRPIPPVVMRTPVGEEEKLPASDRAQDRPAEPASSVPEQPETPAPAPAPAEDTPAAAPAEQTTSDWFAPRKSRAKSPGGGGTPPPSPAAPAAGTGPGETPADGVPGAPGVPADGTGPAPSLADFDAPAGPAAPAGPTTGPAEGDMPLPGRPAAEQDAAAGSLHSPISPGAAAGRPPGHPGPATGRATGPVSGSPAPASPAAADPASAGPGSPAADPGAPAAPADPGAPAAPGAPRPGAGPSAPAAPADPGAPAGGVLRGGAPGGIGAADRSAPSGEERISGDTLVSGIPRVPAAPEGEAGSGPSATPGSAAPDEDFEAFEDEPPAKRGRSKLVPVLAGVTGLVAALYGTGLLLDHADIPRGTTVLGTDIGGMTQHDAVDKLDDELSEGFGKPLTVEVNGRRAQIDPEIAGFALKPQQTARNATGRDYNPVTVIGSLFGMGREAEPVITSDGEKMNAALSTVAMQTQKQGDPSDGMVRFVRGRAVPVAGKPHQGIDTARSGDALVQALSERAVSGRNTPVALPTTLRQPKVGKAELARAVKGFGRTAMSGMVTVKAGDASIQFSPDRSVPKFLTMTAPGGKLVDTYDLKALKQLYGTTFDDVKVQRGNGSVTPVRPEEVVGALRMALRQTDPAQRVQEIPTAPQ